MSRTLKIGSRGSQLALWQANYIQQRLKDLGVESEIEIIRTTGDKITDVPLSKVGGKGLFTKEIEEALLDGRVDLAVHSLKDLPTELPEGLALAAVPGRETPFDALVGCRLGELEEGAVVGTSSLRRAAQLKALRPDLKILDIRGNLDTRLRKLDEGQYRAILLAAAGLRRLGWGERIAEVFEPARMCPAVGQGALGIETRAGGDAFEIVGRLDDPPTRAAVTAERAALSALGGGCQVPLGAHAEVVGDRLDLYAVVADTDGSTLISASVAGRVGQAAELGAEAARRLLDQGARSILARVYGEAPPLAGVRVLVTRAVAQAGALTTRLRSMGAEVVELPVIAVEELDFEPPQGAYDWVLFTSTNAVTMFFAKAKLPEGARVAAIGPATEGELKDRGLDVALTAHNSTGEGLAAAFEGIDLQGKRLLIPRAETAREMLETALRERGAAVEILPVYRNVVPKGLEAAARALLAGPSRPHWVTLMSPSAVKNLLAAVGADLLKGVRIATIGPITSEAARRHGLVVDAEAAEATSDALGKAMVGSR